MNTPRVASAPHTTKMDTNSVVYLEIFELLQKRTKWHLSYENEKAMKTLAGRRITERECIELHWCQRDFRATIVSVWRPR